MNSFVYDYRLTVWNFVIIGVFVVLAVTGFWLDPESLIHAIGKSMSHFVVAMINCVPVIFMAWFFNWVRAQSWFDNHGVHTEMKIIQSRIGTDHEGQYDAIAVAIKYASISFVLGVLYLGFFLA